MNTLFIYVIKVAIYLIAFYPVYYFLLSRDTSYGRNRIFILLSILSSLTLPLFTLQTLKPHDIQFFGKFLSDVFVSASNNGPAGSQAETSSLGILQKIYSLYFLGVIVFLLKFSTDLFNLIFLILRQKNRGSNIISFHGFNTSGFSAMGYVFINSRLSPEEASEIIRHEENHLRKNHFLDIIFIEVLVAFQWFNPVIHLFNRSLRAIHEYQADESCLRSGVPVVNYQNLLLNQVFKSRAFNLSNSFSNPSLIKKRMIMMTKKRTSAIANIKLLLVLPVITIVFLAISAYKEIPGNTTGQKSQNEENTIASSSKISQISTPPSSVAEKSTVKLSDEFSGSKGKKLSDGRGSNVAPPPPPPPPPTDKLNVVKDEKTEYDDETEVPFVVVEEMPMFPGGDSELLKYIGENTNYPHSAKEQNIQGRVIIRFCVTAKGGVSQISILKGVSPELDAEALRVVQTLPAFKPGRQNGKAVPVWYMVPITFTLK